MVVGDVQGGPGLEVLRDLVDGKEAVLVEHDQLGQALLHEVPNEIDR